MVLRKSSDYKSALLSAASLFIAVFSTVSFIAAGQSSEANFGLSDANPLLMPAVGSYQLRIITPSVLELTLITKKDPDPAKLDTWNFVGSRGGTALPSAAEFNVLAGDEAIPVKAVGFKRRALYATVKHRDLRVANYLYL